MKLLLQINNRWVEPEFGKDTNELSLDWSYGSLESPADYIGEYALDFLVPRSQHNNRLFDKFYRTDKKVDPVTFDPAIKLPYNIVSDRGQVISSGTAYIQTVDKDNYKMYLSGALHTIFSKALNSGWDTAKAEEDDEYFLLPEYIKIDKNGGYTSNPKINADMVYYNWRWGDSRNESWSDFVSSLSILSDTNLTNIVSNEIISWIPTHQGTPDGFDTDQWMYSDSNGVEQCWPIFSKDGNELGIPLQIADELREYQMAEFRSYNQQPAIYVKRLWEWYRDSFQAMTGYSLVLDDNWFNDDNPYLKNLFYTLPKLKRNYTLGNPMINYDETVESNAAAFPQTFSQSGVNNVIATSTFTFPQGFHGGDFKINWSPWLNVPNGHAGWYYWNYYDCCFVVTIMVKGSNNAIKYQRKHAMYVIPWSNETSALAPRPALVTWAQANTDEQHYMRYTRGFNTTNRHNMQWVFADEVGRGYDFLITSILEDGDYLEVVTQVHDVSKKFPLVTGFYTEDSNWWEELWGNTYTNGEPNGYYYDYPMSLQTNVNVVANSQDFEIRSNSPISLERLLESENPFSILLKYTKYTNLIWLVDDYNKNVTVYGRPQHFYQCLTADSELPSTGDSAVQMTGIVNLTEYVDTSKDVVLTPIDWGNKYLYMNFEEADADFLGDYHSKFKRTYGSKMLTTPNRRSDETKEMFCNGDNDTVYEACDVSPYYIPIGTAYDYKPLAYQADTLLLNSKDDNTSGADIHGQFVFRNPNGRWNPRVYENFRKNLNGIIISDDSAYEVNNQKYYFHGSKGIGSDRYTIYKPVFSPVNTVRNAAFWFAFPRTAYAPLNYAQDTSTLYDRWGSYLSEMYDISNKTIQCNIHISDSMYRRLKINPLVQIDNSVYIMISMEGYNENSDWVKCTLKQFSSIEGLTAGAIPQGGGTSDENLWQFDDEEYIAFDDAVNIRVGDGTGRIIEPLRPYEPIITEDPVPQLPEKVSDIIRTQGNDNALIPIDDSRI